MKTLVTPLQVARTAFGNDEYLSAESISEADIAAAETRYIRPVLGAALHERLLDGDRPDFTSDYLAPAVVLYTRLVVQPRLDIRTDRCGTTAPRPDGAQPADAAARRHRRRALLTEARTLLRRASRYLAEHREEFPEYDPQCDILNRCSIDGGLVQIR